MADRLLTLGLTDLARELAGEWALARRQQPAQTTEPLQYEPDVLTATISLGREIKPEDFVSARLQARDGQPKALYDIYDEMRRLGIGAPISKCVRKLAGAAHSILPPEEYRAADDNSPEAKAARAVADLVRSQYKRHLRNLFAYGFARYTHGIVGLHQTTTPRGVDGKYQRVDSITQVPPRRFELDTTTMEVKYRPFALSTEAVLAAPFVETGNLIILEESQDSEPLDRRGLLFQCLIVWIFASYGLRWLARLAELCGIPYRAIFYDDTRTGHKKLAADVGRRMGAAGWGAFPKGMEVQFINALNSATGAGDIHDKLIKLAAQCYDQVFFGHSQASQVEVGAGSRTSTEDASEQEDEQHQSRLDELATDYTEKLIRPYVRRNLGDEAADRFCPVLVAEIKQNKDARTVSEIVRNLQQAGVSKIDEEDAIRQCGLVVATDETRAIKAVSTKPLAPGTAQLAQNVLPFKSRFASDEAPDGIGEEIVAPYRAIALKGIKEGATADQILTRVRDRASVEMDAPHLQDQLATLQLNGLMRGITDVRRERARKK